MSLLSPSLEAFYAVARDKTVHGAAKHLGLTQTGVTQRIRSLESLLSTTLFTRSRRGMTLTSQGEALLRYCGAAKDLEGEALSQIHGAGRETETRVCITGPTSIIESRVVKQCAPVLREYPLLLLSYNVVDLENRLDDLRNGNAQLSIVPKHQVVPEMDSKLLRPEKYVLVGSAEWKKRNLKEIIQTERIIDFDSTDRMSHEYLRRLSLLKEARTERHFINNNSALIQMFRQGLGYGVLTMEVAQPFFDRGELVALHKGAFTNELALAWYPRPEMPKLFGALIAAIK
jgi:LysR family transcriptional regulator, chromosome initiation inhibitor